MSSADGDLVLRPPVLVGFERGRRYRVVQELGGGTFGQVWLAETVEAPIPMGTEQADAPHSSADDPVLVPRSRAAPSTSAAMRRGRRRANTDPVRPARDLLQLAQTAQTAQQTAQTAQGPQGRGSGRRVAVKVIKRRPAYFTQGLLEVSILDMLQQVSPLPPPPFWAISARNHRPVLISNPPPLSRTMSTRHISSPSSTRSSSRVTSVSSLRRSAPTSTRCCSVTSTVDWASTA